MDTKQVAQRLVELCREGRNAEAQATFYSPDIVSTEAYAPPGMSAECKGLDAIRAKGEWWRANHEINGAAAKGPYMFPFELDRKTESQGTYPIVLVSYQIACSKYADAAQADLVKGFLTYTTSADGQQAAAQAAGSAPLSDELRSQITPAVSGITAGA